MQPEPSAAVPTAVFGFGRIRERHPRAIIELRVSKAGIIAGRILPIELVEFDGLPILQLVCRQRENRLCLSGQRRERDDQHNDKQVSAHGGFLCTDYDGGSTALTTMVVPHRFRRCKACSLSVRNR